MGNRAHIYFIDDDGSKSPFCIYSHWGGVEHIEIAAELTSGVGRTYPAKQPEGEQFIQAVFGSYPIEYRDTSDLIPGIVSELKAGPLGVYLYPTDDNWFGDYEEKLGVICHRTQEIYFDAYGTSYSGPIGDEFQEWLAARNDDGWFDVVDTTETLDQWITRQQDEIERLMDEIRSRFSGK